jgi:hypothetical protein
MTKGFLVIHPESAFIFFGIPSSVTSKFLAPVRNFLARYVDTSSVICLGTTRSVRFALAAGGGKKQMFFLAVLSHSAPFLRPQENGSEPHGSKLPSDVFLPLNRSATADVPVIRLRANVLSFLAKGGDRRCGQRLSF